METTYKNITCFLLFFRKNKHGDPWPRPREGVLADQSLWCPAVQPQRMQKLLLSKDPTSFTCHTAALSRFPWLSPAGPTPRAPAWWRQSGRSLCESPCTRCHKTCMWGRRPFMEPERRDTRAGEANHVTQAHVSDELWAEPTQSELHARFLFTATQCLCLFSYGHSILSLSVLTQVLQGLNTDSHKNPSLFRARIRWTEHIQIFFALRFISPEKLFNKTKVLCSFNLGATRTWGLESKDSRLIHTIINLS